jgi:hypothetical protein
MKCICNGVQYSLVRHPKDFSINADRDRKREKELYTGDFFSFVFAKNCRGTSFSDHYLADVTLGNHAFANTVLPVVVFFRDIILL